MVCAERPVEEDFDFQLAIAGCPSQPEHASDLLVTFNSTAGTKSCSLKYIDAVRGFQSRSLRPRSDKQRVRRTCSEHPVDRPSTG